MSNEYEDPTKHVKALVKSVKEGPGRVGETVVDGLKGMGETADKVSKAPGKFRKAVKSKFGL